MRPDEQRKIRTNLGGAESSVEILHRRKEKEKGAVLLFDVEPRKWYGETSSAYIPCSGWYTDYRDSRNDRVLSVVETLSVLEVKLSLVKWANNEHTTVLVVAHDTMREDLSALVRAPVGE